MVDRFPKLDPKRYALFVLVNFAAILTILYGTTTLQAGPIYLSSVVLLILVVQYPFLEKHTQRWHRALIFYLAFLAFCYSINFLDAFEGPDRVQDMESLVGLMIRGCLFVILGHLFGLIYLPVILALNWALRRHLVTTP